MSFLTINNFLINRKFILNVEKQLFKNSLLIKLSNNTTMITSGLNQVECFSFLNDYKRTKDTDIHTISINNITLEDLDNTYYLKFGKNKLTQYKENNSLTFDMNDREKIFSYLSYKLKGEFIHNIVIPHEKDFIPEKPISKIKRVIKNYFRKGKD